MVDFAANPVGTTVNPVGQGMQTLSDVMNFKQKRQALQTGQYQQQSAQAEAQQAQQAMGERQRIAQMMQSGVDDRGQSIKDATGEPDPSRIIPALGRIAPLTGQQYAQNILKSETDKVGLQSASSSLDTQQRKMLMGPVQAAALDPNAKAADVNAGIDNLVNAHPEMGNAATYLKGLVAHLDHVPPQGRAGAVQTIAAHMQPGETVQTQGTSTTIDKGPTIQPVVQAPAAAGGGFAAGSGAITKGLSPTDKPAYKQAAAAASATGASRATGVASSDIDRANQVSANIKPAQAGIQTTQQIDDLADQIHSGKFAGWLSKQAAAAGVQESTYARQLLEKDLGIVKTQLTSAAPSDSRAATILSGTPEATSDPQTIHGAMDYVRGSFRQNLAQGQNLSAYRGKHPDLSGFQGADDAFTGTGGPLVHEFLSLKGKDAQAAFYRRNFSDAKQALQFRNQAFAASHTLGLDNDNR